MFHYQMTHDFRIVHRREKLLIKKFLPQNRTLNVAKQGEANVGNLRFCALEQQLDKFFPVF